MRCAAQILTSCNKRRARERRGLPLPHAVFDFFLRILIFLFYSVFFADNNLLLYLLTNKRGTNSACSVATKTEAVSF